jgi:23S rRNA (cytidine1920-2'-O)/16S rRNA (cytidine1409-2'-O)-methyltransferase
VPRRRLDVELVRRGLAGSQEEAHEAIRNGHVTVRGAPATKITTLVAGDEALAVSGPSRPFVSRGGQKLAAALDAFAIDPTGRDCLDAGASTGGFTDCLLQRGATRVIALDVAHGQLEWSLRNDDRVHVIERTNARSITAADLPFEPSLATIDVSFISLAKVLPAVAACVSADGHILGMVKPQFELGRARVKAGVVREPADRREALVSCAVAAAELGLAVRGFASSGLPGPKGNRETFVWATRSGEGLDSVGIERAALEVEP